MRDLPTFGQPVYLKIPRRNFYCRHCQKYVTERLDFLNWRRQYTRRYEENIYQRVLHNNLEQISREEGLTPEQIEGIFNLVSSYVKKKTGIKLNDSVWMKSVNEKVTEMQVTVVSDVERGCLIEVIDSHSPARNHRSSQQTTNRCQSLCQRSER